MERKRKYDVNLATPTKVLKKKCCGGGGGDEECCVCDQCYWERFEPYIQNVALTVDGGGTDTQCCIALIQEGCAQSDFAIVKPFLNLECVGDYYGTCEAALSGSYTDTHFFEGCEFTEEKEYSDSFNTRTLTQTQGYCPNFNVPGSGAIHTEVSDNVIEPGIIVWGGTRCTGPLVLMTVRKTIERIPGEGPWELIMWWVVGANGGAAMIARMTPLCFGWPVIDGCIATTGSCIEMPAKIGGGASVSGNFNCDTGNVNFAGSFDASFIKACDWSSELDQSCTEIGPPFCSSNIILATGIFDCSFSFNVEFNLSVGLVQCPPGGPTPNTGGGLNEDIPYDYQIVIPQEFLENDADLLEVYNSIQAWLDAELDQIPPP